MEVTQSVKRLQDLAYEYKRHLDAAGGEHSAAASGARAQPSPAPNRLDAYHASAADALDTLIRQSASEADRQLQISAGVLLSAADLLVLDARLHNVMRRRSVESLALCRKLASLLTNLTYQLDAPKRLLALEPGFLNAICTLISSHEELAKVGERVETCNLAYKPSLADIQRSASQRRLASKRGNGREASNCRRAARTNRSQNRATSVKKRRRRQLELLASV